MPRAICPACKSGVKYAKGAGAGGTVTCPDCDEMSTPPELKKKGYDPTKDGETYKVGRAVSNEDEKEKTRKAGAALRGAERRARELSEMAKERRRFWFDGPEIWLVIFALGAGGGLPFGLWLARSWGNLGDTKVFLIVVVLLAVLMAATGAAGSA